MDPQTPIIRFFVHQTVQTTTYLQGRRLHFITEMCYSWLEVYLPDSLDIDKKPYLVHGMCVCVSKKFSSVNIWIIGAVHSICLYTLKNCFFQIPGC